MKNTLFVIALLFFSLSASTQHLHHDIYVELNPASNYIKVTDTIHVNKDFLKDNGSSKVFSFREL